MGFFDWFSNFFGSDFSSQQDKASRPRAIRELISCSRVGPIVGRLHHHRIYCYGVDQNARHCTKCQVCSDPHVHVFSKALDEIGTEHRCCLRCLKRLGGEEQLAIAIKRSKKANHVVRCINALEKLCRDFPDPARRPYGEKALQAEIELPYMGYEGIERVLQKIEVERWTEYDRARSEGRPEPSTTRKY